MEREESYQVFYTDDNDNNCSYECCKNYDCCSNKWYIFCLSMMTPIIIMVIVYYALK